MSSMFTKTTLDYWNFRYLLYSFRKGQKYMSQNICNSIVDSNFLFPVTQLILEENLCYIEAVVLSRFEIKLFRVFEVKTAVYLYQPALTNLERPCILKQKTAGLFECVWPFVIILHERVKVISQLPNNVWKLKMMYLFERRFDSVSWKKNKKRKLCRGKF